MKNAARLAATFLALAQLAAPLGARAQGQAPQNAAAARAAKQEAGTRFRKGLELYNDGDYQAALIEFRRAYELAPNYNVLYNIGQVYFQLQDYAGALTALERYLAEGGAAVNGNRRAEVEKDLAKLRQRVAHLDVSTSVDDAEIALDDAPIGKTPFTKPVLVSAGKHKITATKSGRVTATKVFEIASGDTLKLSLELADQSAPAPAPPPPEAPARAPATSSSEGGSGSLVWLGWVATGALAVGAGVTGGLALKSSGDLATQRDTAGATRADLDSGASKTRTLAVVTDVLAASAVVAGGVTLYFTLRGPSKPKSDAPAAASELRLGVRPGGIALTGSF
jgi:hypothetical protein